MHERSRINARGSGQEDMFGSSESLAGALRPHIFRTILEITVLMAKIATMVNNNTHHLQTVPVKGLQLSVGHRRSPSLFSSQTTHLERYSEHSLGGSRPLFETMNPDNEHA